ncbi:hypothetical protein [Actinomadura sp. 9N215]|uniref:hypothetical protein n=1 Tax=Actinomadura sp. 9N215 TaxID=3375150 RepID=UPI00379F865C
MTADPCRRPSRDLQRRIRYRKAVTGESYMAAAADVEAEWARGQRYLSDPSVPAEVAAAARKAGLIPLEPLDPDLSWHWWCRCRRCGEVVAARPWGHEYQPEGRSPRFDAGHEPQDCQHRYNLAWAEIAARRGGPAA